MRTIYFFLIVTFAYACNKGENADNNRSQGNEESTKQVLDHHWAAFKANDLEETMEDYTDESVLITPNGTYNGLEEIRTNFINAFKAFPKDSATFILDKSIVVKDVGYIL